MKKFKVGVIGCGRIAQMYLEVFKALPERIEPVFCVDKVKERAEKFASNFPGCGYSDKLDDLLKQDLEVVHVLTPHFLHKEHVEACLRSGFDVLTEKPIAIHTEDGIEMTKFAESLGRNFGVIFQNRYIEGIQEVKRLYEEGALGKAKGAWSHLAWYRPASYYQCDWKGKWATEGGGVVIDQAIHSIDLVRYVLGLPVTSIKASMDRRVLTSIEVEDVADAAIEFEGGAIYSFFACNYNTYNAPIRIEFEFEKGRALLTGTDMGISIDGKKPYVISPPCGINVQGKGYWGSYHLHQVQKFYDDLEAGNKVSWDGYDATKTLAVVLGIYQSAREQKKIWL
jgi:predicted dehydrogenase